MDIHTRMTFQALVDAIIPPTLRYKEAGVEFVAGAVELCLDQFLISELDRSQFIPIDASQNQVQAQAVVVQLSTSTALMLDIAAEELVGKELAQYSLNSWIYTGGGLFSSMSRLDRLRTLILLDQLQVPLDSLPLPYRNNPGMIQIIIDSFNQLTMWGYYSEWYGYGSTRLFPPDYREIEFFPPSWSLVGYPGPAFGYRDLRGFLLKYPHAGGCCIE